MKLLAALAAVFLATPAYAHHGAPEPCARNMVEKTDANHWCARRYSAEDIQWQDRQAAAYCRMDRDLRLVRGDVLAQQGQYLEIATNKVSWDYQVQRYDGLIAHGPFIDRVSACTADQRTAFHKRYIEPMLLGVGSYYPSYTGGPVYVRAHTRCNARKCWSVRSYTRRR